MFDVLDEDSVFERREAHIHIEQSYYETVRRRW
jgi:hypothetical protein